MGLENNSGSILTIELFVSFGGLYPLGRVTGFVLLWIYFTFLTINIQRQTYIID
jgi:hypothetical protein